MASLEGERPWKNEVKKRVVPLSIAALTATAILGGEPFLGKLGEVGPHISKERDIVKTPITLFQDEKTGEYTEAPQNFTTRQTVLVSASRCNLPVMHPRWQAEIAEQKAAGKLPVLDKPSVNPDKITYVNPAEVNAKVEIVRPVTGDPFEIKGPDGKVIYTSDQVVRYRPSTTWLGVFTKEGKDVTTTKPGEVGIWDQLIEIQSSDDQGNMAIAPVRPDGTALSPGEDTYYIPTSCVRKKVIEVPQK